MGLSHPGTVDVTFQAAMVATNVTRRRLCLRPRLRLRRRPLRRPRHHLRRRFRSRNVLDLNGCVHRILQSNRVPTAL